MSEILVVSFVGDRSLSTENIFEEQKIGLYKCIRETRENVKNNNQECLMNITTFDSVSKTYTKEWSKTKKSFANIKEIPEIISEEEMDMMLSPQGCTRLIDTAYEEALKFEKIWKELKESGKYTKMVGIFTLFTDGMDNMSHKYKLKDLNIKINNLKEMGISMIFMGTNQDAIKSGGNMGFCSSNSLSFDATRENTACAFDALSKLSRELTIGNNKGFSENMRIASVSVSASASASVSASVSASYVDVDVDV